MSALRLGRYRFAMLLTSCSAVTASSRVVYGRR